MTLDSKKINKVLNYSKKYINNLDNENVKDDLKKMEYISLAAFLLYYSPIEHKEVLSTFNNSNIVLTEESIFDYLRKENVSSETLQNIISNGVALKKYNFNRINEHKIIISSYYTKEPIKLIEFLIHELNHEINSFINPFIMIDDYKYIRTGIQLHNITEKFDKYVYVEEAFNVLQLNEIMNIILNLSNFEIEDKEIKDYLSNLNYQGKFFSESYYSITRIAKYLYENEKFRNFLNTYRFNGDINLIKHHIKEHMPNTSLEEIDEKFRKIFNDINEDLDDLMIDMCFKMKSYK